MMLPPFRIRNLHPRGQYGVVQISVPQYESTLKSQPDAALRYLDDDDGETITVGSGFELGQRLEEPVTADTAASGCSLEGHAFPADNMHTFDIQHTSAVMAEWRDHEAYSSKSLRSSSSSSLSSPAAGLSIEPTLTQPVEAINTQQHSSTAGRDLRATIDDAETELDYYENVVDKTSENTVITPSQLTSSESSSSQPEVIQPATIEQVTPSSLESMVLDALVGIDLAPHIETLADFLHGTSRVLRVVADKTRESDTSAAENILDGFKTIFGEVGRLGKAMLETIDSEAAATAPDMANKETVESRNTATSMLNPNDQEVPRTSSQGEISAIRFLGEGSDISATSSTEQAHIMPTVLKSQGKLQQLCSRHRTPPTETLPQTESPSTAPAGGQEINATASNEEVISSGVFDNERPRQDKSDVSARLPISQLDKFYHISSSSFIANQPSEVPAQHSEMYANLEQGGFNPITDQIWRYHPLPDDEDQDKYSSKKKVDFAMPNLGTNFNQEVQLGREHTDQVVLPREKGLSSADALPRSILDLESSDPEFCARFPPLMSIRRANTVGSLRERSRSPDYRERARQDVMLRYPSLQQLEYTNNQKRTTSQLRRLAESKDSEKEDIKSEERPLSHMRHTWFSSVPKPGQSGSIVERSQSTRKAQQNVDLTPFSSANPLWVRRSTDPADDEVQEVIAAVGRDITEASQEIRRLPGAWPDVQSETKTPALPNANESSGEFFGRMTGRPSTKKIEARPFFEHTVPPLRPRASEYTINPRRAPSQLSRAKSITALNPAARLTRPFDPHAPESNRRVHPWMASPKKPSNTELSYQDATAWYTTGPTPALSEEPARDTLRRRATENMPHRRRPYAHRYSGAGRLPWESFENSSSKPTTVRPLSTDLSSAPDEDIRETRSSLRHRDSAPLASPRVRKVNDCVMQLRDMGFGRNDPHEAGRLNVYAAAAAGDVLEAVEMIEEDRKAGEALKKEKKVEGPRAGVGGWL